METVVGVAIYNGVLIRIYGYDSVKDQYRGHNIGEGIPDTTFNAEVLWNIQLSDK